jgi:hypothetical protein
MTDKATLEEIEALAKDATPGPWKTVIPSPEESWIDVITEDGDPVVGDQGIYNGSKLEPTAAHKLQVAYLRETAEVWARAVADCTPALEKFDALQRAQRAKSVPVGSGIKATTTARDYVRKHQAAAGEELKKMGGVHFAPAWPDYLSAALQEAAEKRDRLLVQVAQ